MALHFSIGALLQVLIQQRSSHDESTTRIRTLHSLVWAVSCMLLYWAQGPSPCTACAAVRTVDFQRAYFSSSSFVRVHLHVHVYTYVIWPKLWVSPIGTHIHLHVAMSNTCSCKHYAYVRIADLGAYRYSTVSTPWLRFFSYLFTAVMTQAEALMILHSITEQ
jgi:hypothetical protein